MTFTQQQKLYGALGFIAVWTLLVVMATCGVYSCTHTCPECPPSADAATVTTKSKIVEVPHEPLHIVAKARLQRRAYKAQIAGVTVPGVTDIGADHASNDSGTDVSSDTSDRTGGHRSAVSDTNRLEIECAEYYRDVTAHTDTVVGKDTIGARYSYARQEFTLSLRRSTDSVKVDYLTIMPVRYEKRAWWMDALTHLGAATVGYTVGKLIK